MELDLGDVVPSLAGPRRPQDRVPLERTRDSFVAALEQFGIPYANGSHDKESADSFPASDPPADTAPGSKEHVEEPAAPVAVAEKHAPVSVQVTLDDGQTVSLEHGAVVIAAITSCTNTSNPSVMIAAGLVAKRAVELGLERKPWVKSSLAPGSKVVTEYYERADLQRYLDELGFQTVGYGCTTCIGNSGPLPGPISKAVLDNDLVVASVLSGNRNFEARIHPEVKANYLASPPLVVAFALAGRIDIDLTTEPLGQDRDGNDVYLRDLWPSTQEIKTVVADAVQQAMFRRTYADVYTGDERWRALPVPEGELYDWRDDSTYVRLPPYFADGDGPGRIDGVEGARVLVMVGDSVTTDHISPAGAIKPDSPAGKYLTEHGVERRDFNSYGSRRGNHEVMVRGTFANVRLRNLLVPGSEGTWTVHLPSGEETTIYEALGALPGGGRPARRDRRQGVRLRLVARLGREGTAAPRRQGRDRRKLRAHPPLEPRGDGDPAAPVPRRREPRVARPDRPRGVRRARPRRRRGARGDGRRRRATTARRSSSRRGCGSTRRASTTT